MARAKRIHRKLRELPRVNEPVLRVGNGAMDSTRRELLCVDAMPFHDAFDDGLCVVLIVDRDDVVRPTSCGALRSMRAPMAWNVPPTCRRRATSSRSMRDFISPAPCS